MHQTFCLNARSRSWTKVAEQSTQPHFLYNDAGRASHQPLAQVGLKIVDPDVGEDLWHENAFVPPQWSAPCGFCDGYGLGVYRYNNWPFGQGSINGSGSIVVQNMHQAEGFDRTFAVQCSAGMNPVADFFTKAVFDAMETQYPCKDNPSTPWNES